MFIKPMLLHASKEPSMEKDYICETKFDGVRLILSKFNGDVKLFTRHNNEVTANFKELIDIDIPDGTIWIGYT